MAEVATTRDDSFRGLFTSPSAMYRGKPFWALNGKLEEKELRRQIRAFSRMGMGGAFLHSRVGLATSYLSKEWFKLMKACADECRKLKMEAWLYDEDRWPSGAAGGMVTKDKRFRMRFLEMRVGIPGMFFPDRGELAMFLAEVDGRRASKVRQLAREELLRLAGGGVILSFRSVVEPPSPWFNDQAYLDTLSPEAVTRFIEVTHEAYAASMGRDFGGVVPGIFTDEPNYGHGVRPGRIPWTDNLPQVFRDRYGYDLMDHLPELFLFVEGEDFSHVRRDYRDCLTHLFVNAFSRLIGEWCGRNNLAFTGHVLSEETLRSQTRVVGSAMRFYEHMQAPGIDILCAQILERQGGRPPEYATAKQCASMLRQCGRKWMLSELYGCTGWHFNFAEHKAVGDWQAALGVNLRCPHLSFYTMRGEAKRDYPASISFQSPWWQDYPLVEDYFSRVGVMLSRGEPVRDVAVIHPIESAWGLFTGGPSESFMRLEKQFDSVQNVLLGEHYDFDFVDEDFLARRGRVEGDSLMTGEAVYRVVVVPPVITLRSSTLDKLAAFIDGGGAVVMVGPPPELTDGKASDQAGKLAQRCVRAEKPEDLPAGLASLKGRIRRVSITGADGAEYYSTLYMLRREAGSGRLTVFICHTKQSEASGPLKVRIPGSGQAQEWNALSGEVFLPRAREEGGETEIATDMPGAGSRLFVIEPEPDVNLAPKRELTEIRREKMPARFMDFSLDEPNAVPLDVPEYAINGVWHGSKEILLVDRDVRDAVGLRHRGGSMVQPWAARDRGRRKAARVILRYRFRVERRPAGPLFLVLEEPKDFSVKLNGRKVSARREKGWWIDPSFRKIPLSASLLREGENELVLSTRYAGGSGLECAYLTGRFGMRWDGREAVLTGLPKKLEVGDWRPQGLPCYSGGVTYIASVNASPVPGERTFLELPGWEGVLARIAVNGRPAGKVAWAPHEVEVTEHLRAGENRIEVTIVSSRRNLLGPLHNSQVYPPWTGPGQFVDTGNWTDEYVSVPYGLMEPPVLSYRT